MRNLIAIYIVMCVLCTRVDGQARGPDFGATGTYHVQESEEFFFRAYFRYCPNMLQCPRCQRQVYLNSFGRSLCISSLRRSNFDCKKRSFFRRLNAPSKPGRYEIRMYEIVGEKRCRSHRARNRGELVSVVAVGDVPTQGPLLNITNITSSSVELTWQPHNNTDQREDTINYYIEYGTHGTSQVIRINGTITHQRISDLRPWSPYFVRLCAENVVGNGSYGQVTTFMTLGVPPYLLEGPEDQEIAIGDNFTLRCVFRGVPLPKVTWFKDGQQQRSSVDGTFHVQNATLENGGVYRCLGFNGILGENSFASARVVVVGFPKQSAIKIIPGDQNVYARLGQRLTLSCRMEEDTMMNYEWIKEGTQTQQRKQHAGPKPYELTLDLNSSTDFGIYRCRAKNKVGAVLRDIRIVNHIRFAPTARRRTTKKSNAQLYFIIALVACCCLLLVAIVAAQRHFLKRDICHGIRICTSSEAEPASHEQTLNQENPYTVETPDVCNHGDSAPGCHSNLGMSTSDHYMDLLPNHTTGEVRMKDEAGYIEVISGFNRDYVNLSPSNHNESAAMGMYEAPQSPKELIPKEGNEEGIYSYASQKFMNIKL